MLFLLQVLDAVALQLVVFCQLFLLVNNWFAVVKIILSS